MAQATEAQINLIKKLVGEKDTTAIQPILDVCRDTATNRPQEFTKENASALINLLLEQPFKSAEVPEGMHKFGGVIFKVQVAVHGSGRKYAKALQEDGNGGWAFEFVSGAINNLSQETLLSLEEAKEFGALYGTCCVCGRTLTNEESIAAGIGPICAEKF